MFVDEFVIPALKMNALYQGRYPLVSALSRPLISQVLIDIARETDATAVAHGCTGKGNDQVRFEVSLSALAPEIEVLAPVRDWGMSRDQTIAYAEERGLPITQHEVVPLFDRREPVGPEHRVRGARGPVGSSPRGHLRDDGDHRGRPCSARCRGRVRRRHPRSPSTASRCRLSTSSRTLGKIAGEFGFGRVDLIEDRLVGIKSREIYEAPGALALITAHRDLESLTLERSVAREKRRLESTWADLVYEGLWFSPLRAAIDAFAATTQPSVTGDVRLRFTHGACHPVARRSPQSLYDWALATYDAEDAFDHSDANGFVKLWGLPTTTWSRIHPDE